MQYKLIREENEIATFYTMYQDNTFKTIDIKAGRALEDMLKDVYIITSNTTRTPIIGAPPSGLKTYNPQKVATTLKVTNFKALQGKVYNQFGEEMDKAISWSITGTDKARIKDGKVVEDTVTKNTTYYIVAVCESLEKREKHTIYVETSQPDPPGTPTNNEELEELKAKVLELEKLQAQLEELKQEIGVITGVSE